MANQGSICVYYFNDNEMYNFYRDEKTQILSRSMILDNTNKSISQVAYGRMDGKLINKIVSGNVQVNGNSVIREVVCLTKNNVEIGRVLSRISDGYFEINVGNNTEEVYCVAIDPSFVAQVTCNNSVTSIDLVLSTTDLIQITGAKYPSALPKNFLNNSVIMVDSEKMLVTATTITSNNNFYGMPKLVTVTVTRGYDGTTAASHAPSGLTSNCNLLAYNHIVFAHQVGV